MNLASQNLLRCLNHRLLQGHRFYGCGGGGCVPVAQSPPRCWRSCILGRLEEFPNWNKQFNESIDKMGVNVMVFI